MSLSQSSIYSSPMRSNWCKFSFFSVCALAVCVSLGAALVSISKALVLIAVLGNLLIRWRAGTLHWPRNQPWTIWSIWLALSWMLISFFWTEATLSEAVTSMNKHARLLWLIAIFYLLQSKNEAISALKLLVLGQIFVVVCSYLMWFGVPIPWAKAGNPPELGILFTSTLEQPIMGTLMLSLIWFYRGNFPSRWAQISIWLVMSLTVANVLLIMTGRTGYLVMLFFIFIAAYFALPSRLRILSIILPIILFFTLMTTSTNFQSRVNNVITDIKNYQPNKTIYGQATRIDYWYLCLIAVSEKPLIGHGVGSWRYNYLRLGGIEKDPPLTPHQEFLMWAVESGMIGLFLILGFYICLFRDALQLKKTDSQSLITAASIAALTGLMNCPLFGVQTGEFFLFIFAALLVKEREVESESRFSRTQESRTNWV